MKKILVLTMLFSATGALAADDAAGRSAPHVSPHCNFAKNVALDAIDLADVVELAMCNNPQTRESWLNTHVGRTAYNASLSNYMPDITAGGSFSRNWAETHVPGPNVEEPPKNSSTGSLSLSWLLYDFGGREAAVERTFQNMNSLNFAYNNTLQQVAFEAISAYYSALSSTEALAAARANEDATKKSFELASKKFELGMASKADKLQTETTYVQAQLDTTRQEQVVKTSRANLAKIMGLPPNAEIRLMSATASMSGDILEKSVEELIETAMKKRPDLKAKVADVNASYANVRGSSAAFLPTIRGTASKNWSDANDEWGASGYSVGVSVSMPIFTGFENYYSLRNARYQHAARKEELKSLEQNIELSVVNAYNDYRTGLKSLALARKMYESALENEKVALGSYQAGKGDIIRLMEAQGKLLAARKEMISAQYGVYTYRIALLRAAGELNLKNLGMEP